MIEMRDVRRESHDRDMAVADKDENNVHLHNMFIKKKKSSLALIYF